MVHDSCQKCQYANLLDPKTNEVPAKQIVHKATDAVAIGGLSLHTHMIMI